MSPGGHCSRCYPGTLSSLSSHCSLFKDRVPANFIQGSWSSNELKCLDLEIGHQDSISRYSHHGDMSYAYHLCFLWPSGRMYLRNYFTCHNNDVIMGAMASQITSLTIVYPTAYSGADQGKHQSSASLAFVRGIHRWPVNSPHKGSVTRKMFPFDDVIMWQVFCMCITWDAILLTFTVLYILHLMIRACRLVVIA